MVWMCVCVCVILSLASCSRDPVRPASQCVCVDVLQRVTFSDVRCVCSPDFTPRSRQTSLLFPVKSRALVRPLPSPPPNKRCQGMFACGRVCVCSYGGRFSRSEAERDARSAGCRPVAGSVLPFLPTSSTFHLSVSDDGRAPCVCVCVCVVARARSFSPRVPLPSRPRPKTERGGGAPGQALSEPSRCPGAVRRKDTWRGSMENHL